jgi:hypothetical protein
VAARWSGPCAQRIVRRVPDVSLNSFGGSIDRSTAGPTTRTPRWADPSIRPRWFTHFVRLSGCCIRRIVRHVPDGSLESVGSFARPLESSIDSSHVALGRSFNVCSMVRLFRTVVRSLRSADRSTRTQCFARFVRQFVRPLGRLTDDSRIALGGSFNVCSMVRLLRTAVRSLCSSDCSTHPDGSRDSLGDTLDSLTAGSPAALAGLFDTCPIVASLRSTGLEIDTCQMAHPYISAEYSTCQAAE